MRIVAGKLKGLKLTTFDEDNIRPTLDKVREAIFSKIQFEIKGSKFLDLFGGTGAVSLEAISRGAELVCTVDVDNRSVKVIKENFAKAGKENNITLLEGDAVEILKELEGTYDFIFMDAAKGQYIHFLPDILRLLPEGGMLVSDNVLQDGELKESRFAVTRRNRTIHGRMRDYLYELKHHPDLVTSILPVGDGVTVSVKQPNKDVV